jgi:2-keto-4-pentenoate hydratase/2-oxohepta-3-ene-1,7-dioic acid hydratase in catechol pathway
MRLATIARDGRDQAAVRVDERWVALDAVDDRLGGDMLALIGLEWGRDRLHDLEERAASVGSSGSVAVTEAVYLPPYRHPRLIWGIGLNYAEHAGDLGERQPSDPASFVKGDHTIIGNGDRILLPGLSNRVTTEAEVGLILGREARSVAEEDALDFVFGITTVLDQTAEDILEVNPRYLTRSKNFETFFAFGPEVVTLDSVAADLGDLQVATVVNGRIVRANRIANMLHSPQKLISFQTAHMPMFPGDIISTGTPGAGVIAAGDTAEARVEGLAPLVVQVAAAL